MKIFTVEKIREADAYTIAHEPISSIDLMERAATACTEWIETHIELSNPFIIFCGQGNNGGDGLAIARQLKEKYPQINIHIFIIPQQNSSPDFLTNLKRLQNTNANIIFLQESDSIPQFSTDTTLIDALLGSGLSKPLTGYLQAWVSQINDLQLQTVIAIDVPSGLFCDSLLQESFHAIKATHTLTFQFPKLSFLMKESYPYVGEFTVLPIGLHKTYIQETHTSEHLITPKMVSKMFRKRDKFSHKGNFGHALLIAGSYGKMGAAVLASRSCLRSGVGLLTSHVPAKGVDILQIAVPEAMLSIDADEFHFTTLPDNLSKYTTIGVGPGIGTLPETRQALTNLIENCKKPCVFDADALNIIACDKSLLQKLAPNSILTPHIGEFERLIGKSKLNSFELWEEQKKLAQIYQLIIVLKGAHTCICLPSGESYFNNNGNPGMSTAGSGDVLTGIITSLLAQGYPPHEAAIMGVFCHGEAGDKAEKAKGQQALIASDIIENL